MPHYFITGTGTGVGKTLISSILTQALQADYWKPIQAGVESSDSMWVKSMLLNPKSVVHKEAYVLNLPASPHIAAQKENIRISIDKILEQKPNTTNDLIIEGAGGLMVPLNEKEFVIDLIQELHCEVIIVSRNYLGSINHSLLTANALRSRNIKVLGWIFNDEYLDYESEIVEWSKYPRIGSICKLPDINKDIINEEAIKMKDQLVQLIS